ncbi:MAG: hypothetical protein E6Z88_09440 [Limosilactobacillus fermentum]|nr:hypothetical protein [Limosilactobacillus fermentum]
MFVQQKPFSQWQLPDEDSGKVIIGFDTEYQSETRNHIPIGGELIEVNQRRLEDVMVKSKMLV